MKDYNRNLIFALVVVAVILFGFSDPGCMAVAEDFQTVDNTSDTTLKPLKPPFKNPKMVSALAELVDLHKRAMSAEAQSFAAMRHITMGDDDAVQVVLVMSDERQSLSGQTNIKIEARYKNLVEARVPLSELESLADDPAVEYIRLPLRPHPAVMSEGAGVINANTMHEMGMGGTGVKVAVIDTGFNGSDTNPEIWNVVENRSFCGDITGGGDSHGTACAEAILDVAPNVSLYLYNIDSEVTFGEAANHAISRGVDIISCSLGWANAGPYDGTGFVCDIANNASANGILFVNSAGNQAGRHYEGTYNDPNYDPDLYSYHNFSGADEGLDLGIIQAGKRITLYLSWDDWDAIDQDYDLYLYSMASSYPVNYSTTWQTGCAGQEPTECIDIDAPYTGYYYVAINNCSSRGDAHLEIYSYDNDFIQYNVNSSSLMIPADAGGVMAVGATYWKDDRLEPFSSQGPTNDNRIKPDVVAPDGVSSSIYGNSTGNRDADWASGVSFFGTSASCPHTAGAAALLLSANPSLNNTELQYYLESSAKDLDLTGKDNRTGSGRIDVYAAYQEATHRAFTPVAAAIALRVAVRGEYEKFLDVNSDGAVTSLDALMILQAAGGASI
jgi:subtilisin family serine protease